MTTDKPDGRKEPVKKPSRKYIPPDNHPWRQIWRPRERTSPDATHQPEEPHATENQEETESSRVLPAEQH